MNVRVGLRKDELGVDGITVRLYVTYKRTLVSADSVFAASVMGGLLRHEKNIWKLKEIDGS
jgi:hypothetical protein